MRRALDKVRTGFALVAIGVSLVAWAVKEARR
jgi:hypothetical protein